MFNKILEEITTILGLTFITIIIILISEILYTN